MHRGRMPRTQPLAATRLGSPPGTRWVIVQKPVRERGGTWGDSAGRGLYEYEACCGTPDAGCCRELLCCLLLRRHPAAAISFPGFIGMIPRQDDEDSGSSSRSVCVERRVLAHAYWGKVGIGLTTEKLGMPCHVRCSRTAAKGRRVRELERRDSCQTDAAGPSLLTKDDGRDDEAQRG
ncbi:hypothetical protein LY78DRAFT_51480 [Colletotrichum sublineola]|nr:hypothetical protein LY78DRAFT_51480 [Colletotrichum sublineola]